MLLKFLFIGLSFQFLFELTACTNQCQCDCSTCFQNQNKVENAAAKYKSRANNKDKGHISLRASSDTGVHKELYKKLKKRLPSIEQRLFSNEGTEKGIQVDSKKEKLLRSKKLLPGKNLEQKPAEQKNDKNLTVGKDIKRGKENKTSHEQDKTRLKPFNKILKEGEQEKTPNNNKKAILAPIEKGLVGERQIRNPDKPKIDILQLKTEKNNKTSQEQGNTRLTPLKKILKDGKQEKTPSNDKKAILEPFEKGLMREGKIRNPDKPEIERLLEREKNNKTSHEQDKIRLTPFKKILEEEKQGKTPNEDKKTVLGTSSHLFKNNITLEKQIRNPDKPKTESLLKREKDNKTSHEPNKIKLTPSKKILEEENQGKTPNEDKKTILGTSSHLLKNNITGEKQIRNPDKPKIEKLPLVKNTSPTEKQKEIPTEQNKQKNNIKNESLSNGQVLKAEKQKHEDSPDELDDEGDGDDNESDSVVSEEKENGRILKNTARTVGVKSDLEKTLRNKGLEKQGQIIKPSKNISKFDISKSKDKPNPPQQKNNLKSTIKKQEHEKLGHIIKTPENFGKSKVSETNTIVKNPEPKVNLKTINKKLSENNKVESKVVNKPQSNNSSGKLVLDEKPKILKNNKTGNRNEQHAPKDEKNINSNLIKKHLPLYENKGINSAPLSRGDNQRFSNETPTAGIQKSTPSDTTQVNHSVLEKIAKKIAEAISKEQRDMKAKNITNDRLRRARIHYAVVNTMKKLNKVIEGVGHNDPDKYATKIKDKVLNSDELREQIEDNGGLATRGGHSGTRRTVDLANVATDYMKLIMARGLN